MNCNDRAENISAQTFTSENNCGEYDVMTGLLTGACLIRDAQGGPWEIKKKTICVCMPNDRERCLTRTQDVRLEMSPTDDAMMAAGDGRGYQ